jgi:hypothetical protein
MELKFKKHVIDTNLFTGIVANEHAQKNAISHLLYGHNLADIMNGLKTNSTSHDAEGKEVPRFTFQARKGKSLLDFLSEE